jgi:hypothetical protein
MADHQVSRRDVVSKSSLLSEVRAGESHWGLVARLVVAASDLHDHFVVPLFLQQRHDLGRVHRAHQVIELGRAHCGSQTASVQLLSKQPAAHPPVTNTFISGAFADSVVCWPNSSLLIVATITTYHGARGTRTGN